MYIVLTSTVAGIWVCVEAVLAEFAVPAGGVALTEQTLAADRVTGGRVREVSHAAAVTRLTRAPGRQRRAVVTRAAAGGTEPGQGHC